MRDWIIKIMGIKTYEEENNKLTGDLLNLQKSFKIIDNVNRDFALEVIRLEDELEKIKQDPEMYIEEEIERRMFDIEAAYKDKMEHKWYQIGRQDAYAEMGIRNIEAHEQGNCLAIMEDGSIVELITGLEDVCDACPDCNDDGKPDDEIIIDDLLDVSA